MRSVRIFLLPLCLLLAESVLGKDPWWMKLARKQGPMVCAEEYVQDSGRHYATPWTGGNMCGSETVIRFSCCHGYSRVSGEYGCPLVKPLKNLMETAQELNAKKFVQQAEQSGLLPLLSDRGAYTLFIAPDPAFRTLTREQEKTLNSSKKSRSRPPVLLYTLVEGRVTAEDLPDSLTTLYREGSVFVTRFPNGLTTVNCIPLIATNIEATNGFIHVTESLLLPTGRSTIPDLLVRTANLSTTAAAVVRAQLSNELRDKRPITVFAPTDEAWESLPQNFVEALMEDPSSLKALLQHHVVEGVWCPAVSAISTELKTLGGNIITASCNFSGKYINEAKVIRSDHKAGNGFIHHINSVLIPEKVHSLAEFLESRNVKYFMKLAEVGNLLSLLQRPEPYTVFVPDDEAFEVLPNETFSNMLEDATFARNIVSFHMSSGRHLSTNVIDGQTLNTLHGSLFNLRLKLHKKRLTVESAYVKESDLKTRNGVVHIVDQVIMPSSLSIVQQLQEGNFSTFVKLLNTTEPNLLELLDNATSTFTLFAPSNAAMNETVPGYIARVVADPPLLYKILAHHIIPAFVVSKSLEPLLIYSFTTANNDSISVTKESDGSMTVAQLAQVTLSDVLATNGVLHEISRLIEF